MSYKFIKLFLPLLFLLTSCKREEIKIPLYHIEGINFKVEKKYYHLLYSMNKDVLSFLIDKKTSFFLSIYSESCSSSCSLFDSSLYTLANENDTFIPYIDKTIYDTITDLNLPQVKENAILFFKEGTLFKQIDITEDNVSFEDVKKIISNYTYDTNLKIVTPFYKNEKDILINSFNFSTYDLSNSNIIYPSVNKSDKTLFLDFNRTSNISDIQNTYSSKKDIENIYFYNGLDSLTSDFYTTFDIKKEELENDSSYIR